MRSVSPFKVLLILTLVMSVVSGIGAGAAVAADGLVIWTSEAQVPALSPMAKQFEEEYGVPVTIREVSFGDIRPNFVISAPTGQGPDLIVGAHDWVGELARTGLLEPIELTPAQREQFTPVSLQAFTYGGKLYGLPYAIEAIALMYNKDLVPEPPQSFDELLAIARRLTDPAQRRYGFLYPNNEFYYAFPFLAAKGGYAFRFTGEGFDPSDIGVDNPGAIEGARLLQRLAVEGLVPRGTDYQSMRGLFLEGRVGMVLTGPWDIVNARSAGIRYGVAKIPAIDGSPARPFVGVQGFMVNSFSPNKLLAIEFLQRFVMTKEGQLAIWRGDPRVPALKAAFQEVAADPDVAAFGASAADGIPMPNIPEMAAIWTALNDAMTFIVNGEQTPEVALREAAQKVRNALAAGQ